MNRRRLLGAFPVLLGGCIAAPNGGSDGERRVTDRRLRDTGECADPETATVTVADHRVEARGCITGPDGCAVARLGSVAFDGGTLTVVVTTESGEPPGTACTEALVYRGYEATVRFDGGRPASVRVVHDAPGGRETVATA